MENLDEVKEGRQYAPVYDKGHLEPCPWPPVKQYVLKQIRVELAIKERRRLRELQQAQANSSLDALSNLAGFTNTDAISEFYGYSYVAYNTFAINDTSYGEYVDACELDASDNKTLYFSGSGGTAACPAQGVTLYTNTALTTATRITTYSTFSKKKIL